MTKNSHMTKKIELYLSILIATFIFYKIFSAEFFISSDSLRYLNSGLNLLYHSVYSYASFDQNIEPSPSLGFGGLFTAIELALAAILDQETEKSFICILQNGQVAANQNCNLNLYGLRFLYSIEVVSFFLIMRKIALEMFSSQSVANFTIFIPILFSDIFNFASSILTEPSYLFVVTALIYFQIIALKQPSALYRWFLLGAVLGILCHIKPVWLLLIVFYSSFFLAASLIMKNPKPLKFWITFLIGANVFILPMLLRNYFVLDIFAFSDRAYLIASLSHRVGYNLMSYREWLIGWIYFIPDFGDQLANHYFDTKNNKKLAWGEESFYQIGRDVIHPKILTNVAEHEQLSFLMQNHILVDLKKHIATTFLLSWRGIFISGSISLLSLLLIPFYSIVVSKSELIETCKLAAPLIFILFGNSLVSVSIDRYNMGLVVIYILILAVLLNFISTKLYSRLKN